MQIDIVPALGIQGWMEPFELQWLAEQAARCTTIVEIGSWKGRSTRALADHIGLELWERSAASDPLHERPIGFVGLPTVYVVDDWIDARDATDGTNFELVVKTRYEIEAEWRENLKDHLDAGRIVLCRGNSPDVAPALRPRLPNGADFIFIDGNHNYDGVLADLRAYRPLVRSGGIIAGHDYTTDVHPGVRQAVDEFFEGRAQQGPGSIWWITL